MAYNEALADRIKDMLEAKRIKYTEKKMFGGLCFLVDDKMLLGVEKNRLMTRIDPEDEGTALKKKGAKPMDFTGRVMKGFLFVDDTAVDKDGELQYWIDLCMKYNPKAKSKGNKKAEAKAKAEDKAKDKVKTKPNKKAQAKAKDKVKAEEKKKAKDKVKTMVKSKTLVGKTKAIGNKKAKAKG